MNSPLRVTWRRTASRIARLGSTSLAAWGFLAACASLFAIGLESAEGSRLPVAAVWAASVSPVLPVLAALLGMETWSEERVSGRADLLLSAPVRERDIVLGKFLGVWTLLVAFTALFHFSTMVFLAVFAPGLVIDLSPSGFLCGFLALAMQGAAWSAVAVASSTLMRSPAAAASAAIFVLVAVPRGVWAALMAWAPQGRTAFGEMPLDAHAVDFACGIFSLSTVSMYAAVTFVSLFVASKSILSCRFAGRGGVRYRVSTAFSVLLCAAAAFSVSALVYRRFDVHAELPVGDVDSGFSARTAGVLSETHGEITATVFMSRRHPAFRETAHFLRSLALASENQGGARVSIRYVDPRWDIGAAERLVRSGVPEGSVVFMRGSRIEPVPVKGGCDERACVSAIVRIARPPVRRTVCWTTGHGEFSISGYGAFGMSDIARDIARDGYRNETLDLASVQQIPSDCAFIVVAGAKDEFSRVESSRLDAYLRKGGRLLVLLSSTDAGGVSALLPGWGIRPLFASFQGARTLSGSDVVVAVSPPHPISRPLAGSQIVLEKPVAFAPSAAADGGGADGIEFVSLAEACGHSVAVVVEKGALAGPDIEIRPTRIVAIGDGSFAVNGQLASKASANRDFFHNCAAYLSGTDAAAGSSAEPGRIASGMDRRARARFYTFTTCAFPAAAGLLLALFSAAGRRRT